MTTPMRQQYLSIKSQYPDCILLFRLGDFYETFDDDASRGRASCDVVLTSRPVGNDQRVPLAGVPYHSVDGYIAKLVEAGYQVAIAEQVSEPGKGLVEREVRRVVTKGTVVEPGMLDERRNNYLRGRAAWRPAAAAAGAGLLRHHHRRVCRHPDRRRQPRRGRTAAWARNSAACSPAS